jgi:hypothetical protein
MEVVSQDSNSDLRYSFRSMWHLAYEGTISFIQSPEPFLQRI